MPHLLIFRVKSISPCISKSSSHQSDGKHLAVSMKTAFLIFVVCLGVSTGTIGNGLLYGIVMYERFGVDSMRRTIVNMLWSQLCLTYIFSNTFALPFAIYGYCLNDITGNL